MEKANGIFYANPKRSRNYDVALFLGIKSKWACPQTQPATSTYQETLAIKQSTMHTSVILHCSLILYETSSAYKH